MSQKAYDLINLAAGVRKIADGLSIELLVKNVTNKEYLIAIGTNGLVPAGQAGSPRMIALQVNKTW
jgi:outer membrane receptor protein involved in Fe transport